MQHETIQQIIRKNLDGRPFTEMERFLWMAWVHKDEQYRLTNFMAWLGWAIAIVCPLWILIK